MSKKPKHISQKIIRCARCKQDHEMEFFRFKHPPQDADGVWEYWGMCPVVKEPVFLKFVDRSDPDVKVLD